MPRACLCTGKGLLLASGDGNSVLGVDTDWDSVVTVSWLLSLALLPARSLAPSASRGLSFSMLARWLMSLKLVLEFDDRWVPIMDEAIERMMLS